MRYRCLVLIGPSAAGKTTVKDALVASGQFRYGVTCTTRAPRLGEVDGRDYDFLTLEQWRVAEWNDELAERTQYIANATAQYGILQQRITEAEQAEVPTVWVLDSAGLHFMRGRFAGQMLAVALVADKSCLEERLCKRATDEGRPADTYLSRLERFSEEMTLALQDADVVIDTSRASPGIIAKRITFLMGVR